jgi:F0F1-type ATP synthase delta subunit
MFSELWREIGTYEEWVCAKSIIEELLDSSFKKDHAKIKQSILDSANYRLVLTVVEGIKDADNNTLEKIGEELKNLRELRLTMAIEPSRKLVSKIVGWVKKNVDERAVVSIDIEPKIMGGAVISYAGRVVDFSLSKRLEYV